MKGVALIGMPGSGKTTIGKLLSKHLGWKFIDIDEEIQKSAELSISEIFSQYGEAHFRTLEKETLLKHIGENRVISTGGGIVIDKDNRKLLSERMQTFYLKTPLGALFNRLKDKRDRPLLAGDLLQRLKGLYANRRALYESLGHTVNTRGLSTEEVAAVIVRHIDTGETPTSIASSVHPITVGKVSLSNFENHPVVTTKKVWHIYKGFIPSKRLYIAADGEAAKEIKSLEGIFHSLIQWKVERTDNIVAIGGGALTDAVGFAAATFKRGCKLTNIPTTLLGQVDAAIGGKNAINMAGIKNAVGTFKFPEEVLIDPTFTLSLPYERFAEGIVEGLKMGLVASSNLYEFTKAEMQQLKARQIRTLKEFVQMSAETKLRVVEKDPYDAGERMILNFGHTVGHAIESTYSISHGSAVAIGMIYSVVASRQLGISKLKPATQEEIIETIKGIGILPQIKIEPNAIRERLLQDKKIRDGKLRFVFLKDIGNPAVISVSPEQIKSILEVDIGEVLSR